jgi:hypothetical protein
MTYRFDKERTSRHREYGMGCSRCRGGFITESFSTYPQAIADSSQFHRVANCRTNRLYPDIPVPSAHLSYWSFISDGSSLQALWASENLLLCRNCALVFGSYGTVYFRRKLHPSRMTAVSLSPIVPEYSFPSTFFTFILSPGDYISTPLFKQ